MATGSRAALERDHDLAAFFDDAVIGMAIVDYEGRFEAVNPAMCRLLGYSECQLVGRLTSEVTHPDDRQLSAEVLLRMASGSAITLQNQKRYLRPDGSSVTVVRTTTVLRDGGGTPIGFLAQMVDVTALTEMQGEISRSERWFKELVAHVSDLIIVLDRQGRIRYASPAAVRVLGYSPEVLEGLSALAFIHPDDEGRARRYLEERGSIPGPTAPVGYRVRHQDGAWREVEVVVTDLLDDPSFAALVVNLRDVTEQAEYRRRLEAGERRFRTLVANSWDMISLHDAEGRYLFCSPAMSQLGYQPDRLIGADPFELIHPEDHEAVAEAFRRTADGHSRGLSVEYRFRRKDGGWRWMESIAERRLDDPSIGAVVITTRDVTVARRRARQQQAVAELGQDALRGGPVENLIERILGTVAEALEVPHCHLIRSEEDGRRSVVSSAGPGDAAADVCCLARSGADPGEAFPVAGEWFGADRPGEVGTCGRAIAVPVTPSAGAAGLLAVCSPRPDGLGPDDMAFLETVASILASALSRRNVEEQLRRQAVHDGLTGLPNRALLKDRLQTALSRMARRGGSVAALFVDVDNFKLINDSLGHSVGDSVVAAVADRLRKQVRAPDTVARFGGDEFVVVSEDADVAAARLLADRLRQAVSAPLTVAGRTITVTASIGCAVTADQATSPDSLLADADMAMYEAKTAGKNSVAVFSPELRRRTTDHLETVSGIRRALEGGEFRLHYQPVYDLTTGQVAGYEALLRWQHPASGLVLPDQFIDYAETSGLILPLGKWVIDTGCAQSAAWRRAGRPSKVTINVSGRQLTGADIAADVEAALEETGADPGDIHLEVTESALISDLERARCALDSLHGLGVHLGLDDFGTGWSSLSQLVWLPFEFVKIDRSFVRDLETDQRTASVLESIVALCSTLGMRVIVEGVETASQLDYLKQLDVRLAQGFFLGRPVPPEAID